MANTLLRDIRVKRLKPRLIAATLSRTDYLTLRATVRVLRGSGAPLTPEQEGKVKEFEACVKAYEEIHG